MSLVDGHSFTEELEAIRRGYELLAAEKADEEEEGDGLAAKARMLKFAYVKWKRIKYFSCLIFR